LEKQRQSKTDKLKSELVDSLNRNNRVIATSQMYASQQSLDQGIASVKKNALFAEIVEIKVQFLKQVRG
jgi:uncharacterized protein YegP (UPF0339 family)